MVNRMVELSLLVALALTLAALVVVVIVSGTDALQATGLKELAVLLAGALAGAKIPR